MDAVLVGRPYPLGATWDGEGVNFALFSEHAQRVELCLFDSPDSKHETKRITLPAFVSDARWTVIFDTPRPDLKPAQHMVGGHKVVTLSARSLLMMQLKQ